MAIVAPKRIYEGSRIPQPVPTILEVDPAKHDLADILRVNFGPNHPSTHGVLRLIVDLDGETVAGIRAVIGYLHTGFEKNMEAKTWWKSVTYAPRIDYVSFQANELVYVLAVEKLLELEVPRRATWARMALTELNRIHSHLVWLGNLGARARRDLAPLVHVRRSRRAPRPVRDGRRHADAHALLPGGGLAEDLPPGFTDEARTFCDAMVKSVDDYETILDRNAIWLERTKGIGLLSADDALALAQSGPVLRASGVDWDLRKTMPYLAYDEVEFDVPVYENGDVYDRYKVHMDEMRESVRIVRQCLDRIDETEGQPWITDDRKVVLPPRHELHTSMETLIHHFKLVTEGFTVPEGEAYVVIESPRGESGCYLVSDGGSKPWRVRFRAPSFAALQATATVVQGCLVADLVAVAGSLDPVMGDADR